MATVIVRSDGSGRFGHFLGDVEVRWSDEDSSMVLLSEYVYQDPDGVAWRAPTGSRIDGASIPRVLWSLVGSPFTDRYRNASVVHDVACERKTRPWRQTHRMFYMASRCAGLEEDRAKLMFAGVMLFGSRWPDPAAKAAQGAASRARSPRDRGLAVTDAAAVTPARSAPIEEQRAWLLQLKTIIDETSLSVEEVERLVDERH